MTISNHASLRAKERINLSVNSADKIAKRAFALGKRANEYPAREREYMETKNNQTSFCVTYGSNLFIFSNDYKCITLYPLPAWFGGKSYYEGKQAIRNPKKYYSRYAIC